jgi:hypothetical protein
MDAIRSRIKVPEFHYCHLVNMRSFEGKKLLNFWFGVVLITDELRMHKGKLKFQGYALFTECEDKWRRS